jgi:2-polyprenyl-6-methoxyphenol hydroxylase-like FAD-dependent oxidoreductase
MADSTLIAGAGPSGLTAAIELLRRGMPVRIIDRAGDFAEQSRAIGINPRTLSILGPSGASERLLAEGTRIFRACLHFGGGATRRGGTARLDFTELDTPYPFMLALPQSRTERILNDVLKALGGEVEHETALSAIAHCGLDANSGPSADSVRCRIDGPEGENEVEVDHLIGADGAHSTAHEQAGIAFPGDSLDHDWTIADVVLDWPYPPNELHIFFDDTGFLFTITMGGDRFRLVSPDASPEARLPKSAKIKKEIWRSSFRIHHRQVPTYQVGRVYLAGDAAHVHSPMGARGMNMGISDAATLAWLLSEGREAEYSAIRHPVGKHTIAMVRRQTLQATTRWRRRLAGMVGPLALRVPAVHRFATRFVTGLADPEPTWF